MVVSLPTIYERSTQDNELFLTKIFHLRFIYYVSVKGSILFQYEIFLEHDFFTSSIFSLLLIIIIIIT